MHVVLTMENQQKQIIPHLPTTDFFFFFLIFSVKYLLLTSGYYTIRATFYFDTAISVPPSLVDDGTAELEIDYSFVISLLGAELAKQQQTQPLTLGKCWEKMRYSMI